MRRSACLKMVLATWLGLAGLAAGAELGTAFTYQGRLRLEGLPLNEACDLQFKLWTAAEGGSQVGSTDTVAEVLPSGGEFTAELDFGPGAFAGEARFLEVAVRCPAGSGGYTTLAPRQPVLASPYALFAPAAGEAAAALSAPWSGLAGLPAGFADGVDNDTQYTAGSGLQLSGGAFSIAAKGVSTAMLADNAVTSAQIADNAVANSEIADNAVTTGKILDGTVTKADLAASSGSKNSVLKVAADGQGLEWGTDWLYIPFNWGGKIEDGYCFSLQNSSDDIDGWNDAVIDLYSTVGYALRGESDSGDYAIWGTNGADGVGVRGASIQGIGVYGISYGGSYGVYGKEDDTENFGYLGSTSAGVLGRRGDDTAAAYLAGDHGVYARLNAGLPGSRYAGYFSGPVHVAGTLTKSGGSFKIDHPLDPEDKYLSHSFVESPDMKNVYDGVVVLDERGEAEVALPEWFEALNRDFRYQLTCIGGAALVYIAEEISGNRFRIAGGTRGLKVSWQVTGIRRDAWAQAHRIPVEEDKPAEDRGRYLHPELYGKPATESVDREVAGPDQP